MDIDQNRSKWEGSFNMKKSLLYSSLIAVFTVYLSACTGGVPTGGSESGAKRSLPFNPAIPYILGSPNKRELGSITPRDAHTTGLDPSHVRGGRVYDDFLIELDLASPGPNPLAAAAEGGVAADEWRCSGCHGFDYEGTTTFNGGAEINLQDLLPVRARDEEFVMNMLNTGFMLSDGTIGHNYNGILTPQAMVDVADFVINEIYDVHEVLSAATNQALGDPAEGGAMFNDNLAALPTGVPAFVRADGTAFNCAQCHDGTITTDVAALKVLANAEPFKFMHRSNFGSPRGAAGKANGDFGYGDNTVMPGLYEVVLTDGLHFGGPEQASATMAFVQQ